MRFIMALALTSSFFSLLSDASIVDNRNLFTLRKPVNSENLVQTFAPIDAGCHVGDIDFYWLMNGSTRKVPNSVLRCNILKRLETAAVDPNNKAGCPKNLAPGESCSQKFITAEEIKLVGQKAPLVIRAIRHANGACEVGAYMDLGSKVVQVKQVNTNGRMLSQGFTGATVQFSGVQIVATDGTMAADWRCNQNCVQNVNADLFCRM